VVGEAVQISERLGVDRLRLRHFTHEPLGATDDGAGQMEVGRGCTAAREDERVETTQPELLAHHCTEAGLIDRAVRYWHRAGERTAARSANREAIAHLTRGIEMLAGLPQTPLRDEQELELRAALVTGRSKAAFGAGYRPLQSALGPRCGLAARVQLRLQLPCIPCSRLVASGLP
jgi:hypothetical protein